MRLPLDHAMRARIGWAITAVTTVLAVVQLLMDVPGRVTVDQYVVPIWWGAAIGVVALTIWTELKEVADLAPGASAHAILGTTTALGTGIGGNPATALRHEWIDNPGPVFLPEGATFTVTVWAAGVAGEDRSFKVERISPIASIDADEWLPTVAEVAESA